MIRVQRKFYFRNGQKETIERETMRTLVKSSSHFKCIYYRQINLQSLYTELIDWLMTVYSESYNMKLCWDWKLIGWWTTVIRSPVDPGESFKTLCQIHPFDAVQNNVTRNNSEVCIDDDGGDDVLCDDDGVHDDDNTCAQPFLGHHPIQSHSAAARRLWLWETHTHMQRCREQTRETGLWSGIIVF